MEKIANHILFKEVETALRNGKSVKIRTVGTSMRPFLTEDRDVVIIIPYTHQTMRLYRGDIVLFKIQNSYLLHRVISIKGDHITLCGDNVYHSTENIFTENIIGILHSIIRHSGRITFCKSLIWRTKSFVWISLFPIRRFLLCIYRIMQYVKRNRKQ